MANRYTRWIETYLLQGERITLGITLFKKWFVTLTKVRVSIENFKDLIIKPNQYPFP